MRKMYLLLLPLVFSACALRIYEAPDFQTALARHRTVAILPAEVTMQLRPNQARSLGPEALLDLQRRTSRDVQEKIHGWFLRRGDRLSYTVSFQDVSATNAKLVEGGVTYQTLADTDRARLAQMLGVDAVLQARLVMDKPMSEGVSVALGVLVGFWGTTNQVKATVNIHDGNSGTLLWKYDNMYSGSAFSSSVGLTDALMRHMSRRFPYNSR